MNPRELLRKIRLIGVKPGHEIWEIFLIRKINFLCFMAFLNCSIAFVFFPLIGITDYQWILGMAVIAAVVILVLNSTLGYLFGRYGFFLMGMDLINSLCDQLEGKHRWWNDNGFCFEVVFD